MGDTDAVVISKVAIEVFDVLSTTETKRAEISEIAKIPHPVEFDRYYNL